MSAGVSLLSVFSCNWEYSFGDCKLHLLALGWYGCLVDKGQRKRTADIAEKLGVGLLLGTMIQGIIATDPSSTMYGIGAIILAIAFVLLVFAIYISREE